jgi:hypothetical protein
VGVGWGSKLETIQVWPRNRTFVPTSMASICHPRYRWCRQSSRSDWGTLSTADVQCEPARHREGDGPDSPGALRVTGGRQTVCKLRRPKPSTTVTDTGNSASQVLFLFASPL